MRGADRQVRQAEVEAALAVLSEHGWRVEFLGFEDEDGEPYRCHVRMSAQRPSVVRGPL